MSKELKVGLFMIVTISLLYFGFNYLRGTEIFETTNRYYAKYNNVAGLTVSNPVTLSGYSIGRVSNITINQKDGNHVVVELDIESNISIGTGARAILDIGLLGETQITIDSASFGTPIQPGDTITSYVDQGIITVLGGAAGDISTNLVVTIKRINAILDKFTGSGDQINNMVDNLEQTTANAKMMSSELRRNFNEVTFGYKVTVDNLNQKINQLEPILMKYGELADSLKSIQVQPTLDSASILLSDIRALVAKIDQSEGTLQKLIEDEALYNNLNQTLIHLDSMIIHMDRRPKDFFKPLGRDKPKGIGNK